MSLRPKLLVLPTIAALVVAAHACSRSTAPPEPLPATAMPAPSPTPTPVSPEALLRESGHVMANLGSFRFLLEHPSGGTPLDLLPGLAIAEAEGGVISPDRLEAHFGGVLGTIFIKSSLITVGADSYMTNPITGLWESVPPEISPLGFFNPKKGIASMMTQVDGARLVPDGQGLYRVAGKIPAEALAPLLGQTLEGAVVSVELAIDVDEFYLKKAEIDGRVTPREPDGTIRVITLSHFNEPFKIEAPE